MAKFRAWALAISQKGKFSVFPLQAQERFAANICPSQPDPKLSVVRMGSGGFVADSQTDFEHHDFNPFG
jgi:hypothetical protein